MNKQKALHALRGLEMTFEQKQEFIEALAEGDSAENKEVVIDIRPITNEVEDHIDLTDEQIESIKNKSCTFIESVGKEIHYGFVNYMNESSNQIQVSVALIKDDLINLVVNKNTKRLAIKRPI